MLMLLLQKKKKKLLPPSSETDLTSMRRCDLQLKKKQETMQVRIEYDSIDVVQISPNVLIISNHGMWLVIREYVLNRNMN